MPPADGPSYGLDDDGASQSAERELIRLIRSRESLLLVGAGFSAASGFPTWTCLLQRLAAAAREVNAGFRPRNSDPLDIADEIYEELGKDAFETAIGRIFQPLHLPDDNAVPLEGFQKQLVRLPFRGYLTTNYDCLLEIALVRAGVCTDRPASVAIWNDGPAEVGRAVRSLAVRRDPRSVLHLHGKYTHPVSVVLARRHYDQAYGNASRRHSAKVTNLFLLVTALLLTRRLVFVGFSLEDQYFEQLIGRVSDLNWEWGSPIHYAILPRELGAGADAIAKAERLRNELAIQPVFYPSNGTDHTELHRLIDRIYQAVLEDDSTATAREDADGSQTATADVPDWIGRVSDLARRRILGNHED